VLASFTSTDPEPEITFDRNRLPIQNGRKTLVLWHCRPFGSCWIAWTGWPPRSGRKGADRETAGHQGTGL